MTPKQTIFNNMLTVRQTRYHPNYPCILYTVSNFLALASSSVTTSSLRGVTSSCRWKTSEVLRPRIELRPWRGWSMRSKMNIATKPKLSNMVHCISPIISYLQSTFWSTGIISHMMRVSVCFSNRCLMIFKIALLWPAYFSFTQFEITKKYVTTYWQHFAGRHSGDGKEWCQMVLTCPCCLVTSGWLKHDLLVHTSGICFVTPEQQIRTPMIRLKNNRSTVQSLGAKKKPSNHRPSFNIAWRLPSLLGSAGNPAPF